MGEPRTKLSDLEAQVKNQFPASQIVPTPEGFIVYTVHGVGTTANEALQNSLVTFHRMAARGKALPRMLDEILTDLSTPGMNRERHDNFQESLTICENALNDGVLTQSIPWIEIPRYTREINELRRRVSARLGVAAQNAKDHEQSKAHAAAPVTSLAPRTWEQLCKICPP